MERGRPQSGCKIAGGDGWKIKQGAKELTVPTIDTIRKMAQSDTLKRDDYVWNPTLDKWLYAKDTAELDGIFSKAKARELNRASWVFFLFSILVGVFISPAGGGVLFVVALILAVLYYVKR